MAWHSNYWSCSKFADWVRGTPKLECGTSEQWRDWKKESRSKHPYRFWIAEEALGNVQDFITWPERKLNDIRYYIVNRWVSRAHSLTAHARDIKPGDWSDVGNRFLPCLFNELVDFVEIEQAWHHVMWNDEARKKYNVPWYRSGWLRWRTWRCPEAGLDHLDWAATLTNEEFLDEDKKHLAVPTHQAIAAKEIKELYLWWTQTYRNRPDPMDASGWSAYCDYMRNKDPDNWVLAAEKTKEEKAMSNKAHKLLQKIETAYEKEDEAMMIRLIKVRGSLWT